jgi:hypothetical protein
MVIQLMRELVDELIGALDATTHGKYPVDYGIAGTACGLEWLLR